MGGVRGVTEFHDVNFPDVPFFDEFTFYFDGIADGNTP